MLVGLGLFLLLGCGSSDDVRWAWTGSASVAIDIHDPTASSQPDVCVPSCAGKECGSDGCSGSCGDCPKFMECQDYICVVCDSEFWNNNGSCDCDYNSGVCEAAYKCFEELCRCDLDCCGGKACQSDGHCDSWCPKGEDPDCSGDPKDGKWCE